jgi:hypothetical protein
MVKKPKRMTFWVSNKDGPKPEFKKVVDQLYRQYAKLRGNIVGHRLRAPEGATTRQISLALRRVRERWAARSFGLTGTRKASKLDVR